MRFKANSDSPGSKSLLSGEGQRAGQKRKSEQIMLILKNNSNDNINNEGKRTRPEKEISTNNVKDNVTIILKKYCKSLLSGESQRARKGDLGK